jgi:cyclopropane fatty-acyl-phospholipid synthase-like methyltransferase
VRKLNLGCGKDIREGYINVDLVKGDGVDFAVDLDVAPWPFVERNFDKIVAYDVFEHVHKPVTFMTECHRLLHDGGLLHMRTPHYMARHAYTDPTHVRFPTENTWDYWIPGTLLHDTHNEFYGNVSFERINTTVQHGQIFVTLRRITR